MQLTDGGRPTALRARLGAAACVLIASGLPSGAGAEPGAGTQLDVSALVYSERNRTNVVEPAVRLARTFADGQSLSAQFEFDAVSGASPTGASRSTLAQTVTGASGAAGTTIPARELPTRSYTDRRFAGAVEWQKPFLRSLVTTLSGYFSRETDYLSLGAGGKLAIELPGRRTTLNLGGAFNHDRVSPEGGFRPGLSDAGAPAPPPDDDGGDDEHEDDDGDESEAREGRPKDVSSAMVGLSQVVSRRWLVGVNATRTFERGYLTDPYKLISALDPVTGEPVSLLTEKRPDRRERTSVLGSSVYHLAEDVVYLSYRYYWDDWKVRSHTWDLKYRRELGGGTYLEPHVRHYRQGPAEFFRPSLVAGAPLPGHATADGRLGELRSITAGATVGFRLPGSTGEWTVRAEYIAQLGQGHPADAVGIQRDFDLAPRLDIGSLLVSYSVGF